VIEVAQPIKRCGDSVAIDVLSVAVRSGVVADFLGPNESVKSTTIGLMVGLDRPTPERALSNGKSCDEVQRPVDVGALWEAKGTR
jgi:ABC-2 type transport system ATP-binding protein